MVGDTGMTHLAVVDMALQAKVADVLDVGLQRRKALGKGPEGHDESGDVGQLPRSENKNKPPGRRAGTQVVAGTHCGCGLCPCLLL